MVLNVNNLYFQVLPTQITVLAQKIQVVFFAVWLKKGYDALKSSTDL